MAHYLLRPTYVDNPKAKTTAFRIVEAESARQAIEGLKQDEGSVEVWTLRTGEPRTYTVSTETTRTIKQT